MEMVVAHAVSGESLPVSGYFDSLHSLKKARGVPGELDMAFGRCIGLHTPEAACGLDNGFNLLETALAPIEGGPGGLAEMSRQAHEELSDTLQALQVDHACVLNAAQHPVCRRDAEWYARVRVPRPIYRELVEHRGWHHWEGIDAKAQNGANTSVPVERAVEALNVVIGLAPASVALFANSPLESGRVTGFKANRLTLWDRMFTPAVFPGDLRLSRYPTRPFQDLADYFMWLHGPGTVTRGLPLSPSSDYKSVSTVLLDDAPCLYEFLHASTWSGRRMDTGEAVWLSPATFHFEYSHMMQFLDARLRFCLGRGEPELSDLLSAWRREGGLESLFAAHDAQMYVEGRAPGAGFADACLLKEAGREVARSLLMAPSALQAGLLSNLDEALRVVAEWGWTRLGELRASAMRDGLDCEQARALCSDVLAVAREGLAGMDRPWLAYAEYVLESKRTGADRMLDTWNSHSGSPADRLAAVLEQHAAQHPDCYGGRLDGNAGAGDAEPTERRAY